MDICKFSNAVASKLGHYVYLLINPIENKIFYVGKGKGNRCFSHFNGDQETKKMAKIQEIRDTGYEPVVEILTHNLPDEETAFKVEAAVIDVIGMDNLTNQVRGKGSTLFGRMTADEIASHYEKKRVKITHPSILIRINQLYRHGIDPIDLYDATRGYWVVGDRREKAKYAFAVFKGIVVEVYEIMQWFPAGATFSTRDEEFYNQNDEEYDERYDEFESPARWEFVGRIARHEIRDKYRNKSVDDYFSSNAQNPIQYVNC